MPRKDKDWKFALAASPATEGWIVSIRAEDGTVGYGYASTMNHYGAPHEAVKGALDRLCKPLIGRDFARDRRAFWMISTASCMGTIRRNPASIARCTTCMARRLGVPICDLFGGPAVREFASLRILPIKSPADMAKNARALADQGCPVFQDQGPWRGQRGRGSALQPFEPSSGPKAHLTIDANQSYAAKDAIRALNLMAPYGSIWRSNRSRLPISWD